jgi:hypothetical protein
MQLDTTTILLRVGLPVLTSFVGVAIGAVSRRWWETRIFSAVTEADLVAHNWEGTFQQEGKNADGQLWQVVKLKLTLTSRWKRVSGTIHYGNETLHCSGGFFQNRVLTLHYWSPERGRLQSGMLILHLPGMASKLSGYFAGYGPESDRLVNGSVTVAKATV